MINEANEIDGETKSKTTESRCGGYILAMIPGRYDFTRDPGAVPDPVLATPT